MSAFERLEQILSNLFRRAGRAAGRHSMEPLEIRRGVLREIAAQVQPRGGGEYFFPHTRIDIEVFARDAASGHALEGLFDGRSFARDIAAELESCGCNEAAPRIDVRVSENPEAAASQPYKITYSRSEPSRPEASKPRPPARLIVTQGKAEVSSLEIDRDEIFIGRTKEVLNKRAGIDRQNQLAFDDTELKVSRKHALVRYDAAGGRFRAFNDPESQAGTTILRDGRSLVCDSTRGVPLRTGDELILGSARIRFELL
jgi:pSer/pThr/pTyr-binding forkhead associated (FHA) protein